MKFLLNLTYWRFLSFDDRIIMDLFLDSSTRNYWPSGSLKNTFEYIHLEKSVVEFMAIKFPEFISIIE